MRRVAFYIDSLKLGGAERVTLQWSSWCQQAGWDVVLLTRKPPSWDFYPLPPGVRREVEPPDKAWVRCLGPLGFPFRVKALHHWLKHEQVSLAIGVTSLPAIKLLFAARALGLPCVVSERNFPPLKRIGRVWSVLRRISYPWAALHLVQTDKVGSWMALNLGARRQLLLPNSVQWPLQNFDPRVNPQRWLDESGARPLDPVILAVGTKAEQKGFDRLVRWWIPLAFRHPSLHLVILGLDALPYHGRDQQSDLRDLLKAYPELTSRLHFPGRVGNVTDWYQRAQLFVLSSRYEGFPNVLLEAMAAGCCCIAADCPHGPADLINNDVNGLLVPTQASEEDWVQVLEALLLDAPRRQRLSRSALAVREDYSPSSLKRSLINALNCVIQDAIES